MSAAKLALEDGTVFTGISFGAAGEVDGEVCFNTSMTGYQEILTDPSYRGQIVTMTYPEIGNYGVNAEDVESRGRNSPASSSAITAAWPATFARASDLDDYLIRAGRRRHRRHRHAGAGAAHSAIRGAEGRALDHRSRRRQPGGQGQGQPRPGRPRPGARSRAAASRATGTNG